MAVLVGGRRSGGRGALGDTERVIEAFDPLATVRLSLEPITAQVARSIAAADVSDLGAADGWPQAGTRNGVAMALEHGHPAAWLVRWEGRVIGDCGIHRPVDDTGSVEIGYGLACGYRGRGFGSEIVAAISDWLLAQPGVSRVRASTLATNTASRRVLEKAGFTLVSSTDEGTVYERRT